MKKNFSVSIIERKKHIFANLITNDNKSFLKMKIKRKQNENKTIIKRNEILKN